MNLEINASAIAALKQWDTPTLANAIETFNARPRDTGYTRGGIRSLFPDLRIMVGFAATASIRAAGGAEPESGIDKYAALYEHVQTIAAPCVVVVHDHDVPVQIGSMWGEVNAAVFQALGCIGSITDGTVRDLLEVRRTGFQFFAASPGVSHGYVRLETVGEPVEVSGLVVAPGDLLAADEYGVLSIPAELAAELPDAAQRVTDREQEFIRWVRSAEFSPSTLATTRVQH